MGDLVEGQTQYVKGSGKSPYELKLKGGVYSCSCPAWRNQSNPIDRRTCKHLKMVRGDATEFARVNGINQSGTTTGRVSSKSPNQVKPRTDDDYEFTPRADGRIPIFTLTPEEMVAAGVMSREDILSEAEKRAGRKLRPDEKTKLFGPPVLLAHPFEDSDTDPTGWWMSEKLDGVRAWWDGKNFVSRQGNIFHAPDWFKADLPNHPLDGELWMDRRCFQQTISIVKSIDAGERWKAIKFMVFDMPHLKGSNFERRQDELEQLMLRKSWKHVKMVQQRKCEGIADLKRELSRTVELGAEGLMIRQPGSLYEAGRSWSILKVKPWKDMEVIVRGYEAGKGRHKGRLGGLLVELPNGKTFNVGTGLSDAERKDPPPIGCHVTIRYMDTTDDGIPKGASFLAVRDYE